MVQLDIVGLVCGGAFIDEKTIITAAHCFCEPEETSIGLLICPKSALGQEKKVSSRFLSRINAYAGNNEINAGKKFPIREIFVHEYYQSNAQPLVNDIALIILKKKVDFHRGKIVAPICLPDVTTKDLGMTVRNCCRYVILTKTHVSDMML